MNLFSLIDGPLVDETGVASLAHSDTMSVVFCLPFRQLLGLREYGEEREEGESALGRRLRVQEEKEADGKLPATERTSDVGRKQTFVVVAAALHRRIRKPGVRGVPGQGEGVAVAAPLFQRRLLVAHETVVLLFGGFVAEVANLHHALRADGAGPRRRPLLLYERVVGLVFCVRPRV